jgi:hypothetical protein
MEEIMINTLLSKQDVKKLELEELRQYHFILQLQHENTIDKRLIEELQQFTIKEIEKRKEEFL